MCRSPSTGAIIQRDVSKVRSGAFSASLFDGIPVILRGDMVRPDCRSLTGWLDPRVPEPHLLRVCSGSQGEQLMAQTDAKQRPSP